jgi:hypothetical protein
MNYESRIDPTDLATVARYLRDPTSPIHYVLHVRDRAFLAPLAAELDAKMTQPGAIGRDVLAVVEQRARERALVISPRPSGPPVDTRLVVDLATLPGAARCDVIYLPPFYLAHTPGLFEGTLVRHPVTPGQRPAVNQSPGFRLKL